MVSCVICHKSFKPLPAPLNQSEYPFCKVCRTSYEQEFVRNYGHSMPMLVWAANRAWASKEKQ